MGGFIRDQSGVTYQHRIIIANRLGDARSCAPPALPSEVGEFLSPTGTNVCLRRDCLVEIGGFDEAITYFLEETDVNLRLIERGWSIGFVPDAEVHHYFLENEVRNGVRVPRSLYPLARSKAYFCRKHGPSQYSEAEIAARLGRYRAQLRRHLVRYRLTGHMSGADARRLRGEIVEGRADGERSASQALGRAASVAGAPDLVASKLTGKVRRPRVCWISSPATGPDKAVDPAPREFAGLGHEVTAISPVAGAGTTVCFDGAWRHGVGLGIPPQSAFWRRYARAALREVERIQPRRCFDVVFCPGELQGALSPLTALGIKVVASSAKLARDVDASTRLALAALPG